MSVKSDDMDVDGPSSRPQTAQPHMDPVARKLQFDEQYPNRPRNKHKSLPFYTLLQDLFVPLGENQKARPGQRSRRQIGPDHGPAPGSLEMRRNIIERYISRWKRHVGPDFFPAMRLILPEKDRDRAMYGLKEKNLGKLLVKIMKIDKNSDDGFNILNWKVPGKTSSAAGDFPGRCYEVLQKRQFREKHGDMTIEEVNEQLDKLSAAQKEDEQLPLLTNFYRKMNADELLWLIRIILRQTKIGATEKTVLDVFHPDAENLFNVSSSLRRVCWLLSDTSVRLETESRGVTVMQCFQPQLAHYDNNNFPKMVQYLRKYSKEGDNEFWIEEKLDGERIQMHMRKDQSKEGGLAFKFFSRKAKDYTYLYGEHLYDQSSALTQFLKEAFEDDVDSIVLDGEMITWDPKIERQVAFGSLKTAALSEKKNPFTDGERPLYRVFDVLLVNDQILTQYTLRDRREALKAAVKPVKGRFEIHEYQTATEAEEIDPILRKVIEDAAEGLVLKNPRSSYTLGIRTTDWLKVKPEYMNNYGESIDCLIIAGYFGSGKRGGFLSSFLCGLRKDRKSKKFLSFFKVGGGMAASDYAAIQNYTEGKWMEYNPKNPPTEYIGLAGAPKERPDQWIKPEDSIVVEVKAASIGTSDEFATNLTLRFPRFKKIRSDKDWTSSLTVDEFLNLKSKVEAKDEEEDKKKKFEAEQSRVKRRTLANRKRPLKVIGYGLTGNAGQGNDDIKVDDEALQSAVFHGLVFYVVTDSQRPIKKTKPELEALIKRHGGKIVQTNHLRKPEKQTISRSKKKVDKAQPEVEEEEEPIVFCIADRRNVKVASLEKSNDTLLIRPSWIFDSIEQAKRDLPRGLPERVVLFEPERHLFFTPAEQTGMYDQNVDKYGDAFTRETNVEELQLIFDNMNGVKSTGTASDAALNDLIEENSNDSQPGQMRGWMFKTHVLYFDDAGSSSDIPNTDVRSMIARTIAQFAGASIVDSLKDGQDEVTQIVASPLSDLRSIRKALAKQCGEGRKIPRLVTPAWVLESWKEGTVLDDERFEAR